MQQFPKEWESWLRQNVALYGRLDETEQGRLRREASVLVDSKSWEGCDGLKVSELMKLTVAAQAALLILGLEHEHFTRVKSVVLFPGEFELPAESWEQRGRTILGQAVNYGTVYLSWGTVLAEARDPAVGHNLVIHEFAHQLDFLDGYTNGTPPLRSGEQTRRWHVVMQGAFHRLRRDLQQGQKTFLGSYAATNPTEFFSVTSEKFFTLPAELRRRHPQLFAVLAEYYRVDPVRWFDGNAAVAAPPATPGTLENMAAENAPLVHEREPELVGLDFIDYQCPYCHNPVSFPKADAGALKACPNCLEPAFVPERGGLPASGIPIPVRTERLVLRRFEALDAKDLAEVVSKPESLRYLNWTALTLEEAEDWVARQRQRRFPQPGEYFNFAIEAVQPGSVIGFITFWFWGYDLDVAQFELAIHPQWQGKGFGAEAVRGLFGFAFAGMRIRRLVAKCDSRNLAARKLLLKVGMRQESACVEDHLIKGQLINTVGYAILKREFEGGK